MDKDKLWKGRIDKAPDILAEKFTSSIYIDRNLYLQDIAGTAAYAIGLESIGIISVAELKEILTGLKKVKEKISSGKVSFEDYEDIHSLIEYELVNITGEAARKIHTGRSRNDQIVTDELILLKHANFEMLQFLTGLQNAILKKAEENKDLVFPAYTHMQKAQPVLVSHYLLSYFEKFSRDIEKFFRNFNDCDYLPLGAGACTGSGYPVNTKLIAELLKFSRIGSNSMDIVSSRDFIIDFIYCCSMTMLDLSRFCEDLIIYNTQEFSFVEIDDSFCTGSSIMPQKKNPDILEIIRGKSALVIGNLMQVFTLMKGLPSTYNSDMQEDKKIFFNAYLETLESLKIFVKVLESIEFKGDKMSESCASGFLEATDAADYLVKKGESFRSAHNIIGRLVKYCIENNLLLKNIPLEKLQCYSKYFDRDFYSFITTNNSIAAKVTGCGTSIKSVKSMLRNHKKTVGRFKEKLQEIKTRIPEPDEIIASNI